ncbi:MULTISPECIES: BREX-1 system adenine-specific DNA-methyltransferase PglX [unclassified Priestia]|uniref:BREX-1 system adenine-specific DNA-methyltransferase PglX n=1 Tax=unclassified Priestia TaxID=2800374 RepID=UPI00366BDDD1
MNKTALKTFATTARKELLKKVEAKAMKIGITRDAIKKADIESSDAIFIDGKQLSQVEKIQRNHLIARIKEIGFDQVMDEVAYTWFNRITALRYMEVNNYLPTKVRVLSSTDADRIEPDMMKEALNLDLDLDKELVYDLKLNNKTDELFKYLIIEHCNDLNRFLPFMFERIDHYTQILFPEGLLATDSFVRHMTNTESIPEENWRKIEVIGWLYQYYIVEEKDRVFKAKKKYKPEEIPFATQLFTPDWIVRYMVQNSLGRYWIESHAEHRELIGDWEFYLENSISDPSFEGELDLYINKELRVEDIKCFDPAMGSGHILVYMFDVLYEIYSKCGYMEREIPRLILENNLYGLDIDDRANQLACFSVVMKALEYNKRFFRSIEREGLTLHLASLQETNYLTDDDIAYIAAENTGSNFNRTKEFIEQFQDAKTTGSLIKLTSFPKEFLEMRLENIKATPVTNLFQTETREKCLWLLTQLIKQADIMVNKFDVLVTNPPYMGSGNMNTVLSSFLKKHYPNSKTDLFASFMELDHYLKETSFYASINQHSWMFLSSYENLRKKIIQNKSISSMLHLGTRAFEEIGGEVVQSTAFVLRNSRVPNLSGIYIRLIDQRTSKEKKEKTLDAVQNPDVSYRYSFNPDTFNEIPGSPIAYWINEKIRGLYSNTLIGHKYDLKEGVGTRNDAEFLRLFWEVSLEKIGIGNRWVLTDKAGSFKKWYMGFSYVMDWENDGQRIKNYRNADGSLRSRPQNLQFLFREGVTWGKIGSGKPSFRWRPSGFAFNDAAPTIFGEDAYLLLAQLNSDLFNQLLKIQGGTLNLTTGVIGNLPILNFSDEVRQNLKNSIDHCTRIAVSEWNSYETSIDFDKHPFIKFKNDDLQIAEAYNEWESFNLNQRKDLKLTEEKINLLIQENHGLEESIASEVSDDELTLNKADCLVDTKSFISYAVGCMFGRYSLDEEGLIYAGGKFDPYKYKTFKPNKDNILPILPGSYFEDDIVSRFVEFVQVAFGKETLLDNLDFIADTLGKNKGETSRETIRRYFLKEFFKNHVQTYKKRPIYWLFTSGKQKAFNCLVYMHRYDKTTLSRIRTDYLHEYQIRMDAQKKDLLNIIEGDSSVKEINSAKKELKDLDKKIVELKEYDELLHHMADMQVEIDLNDGVAVNYEKFKGLVAKI